MSDKPIFEQKMALGMGLWIFEDKVIISEKIGNKTTIPMSRIASTSVNLAGTIAIETTGGKSFRLLLGKRGKEAKELIDQRTL